MAIFYTDTGSINRLEVTGSLDITGSSNILNVKGSGSKIFVVSGSSGALLEIGDISGTDTDLYVIESASIEVFKIDKDKNVRISGSLTVTGSFTASLQSGYAWVGDGNGLSRAVQTSSFAGTSGYTITTQTTTYNETATSGTKIILCNTSAGGFTVTLPTAVGNAATIIVKKIAGIPPVVVDGNGSELIDDGPTATLYSVYESITLISDNTEWYII